MDDQTKEFSDRAMDETGPCKKPFSLSELQEGRKDKLGHEVEEILWIGRNYAIYRSQKGVYVQFSDCPQEETVQRSRFTEISPELCELRYLTYEMRSGWFGSELRAGRHPSSLYEHNMAQALMLVMEDKGDEGEQIAQQALKMAVERVTNDNTVRYFGTCLCFWILSVIVGALVIQWRTLSQEQWIFVVAAVSGATGAMLSVATRLQAFQFKPCHQSNMNYLMSFTRVGVGLIAGPILLLLSLTILNEQVKALVPTMMEWRGAAVLGLIGGFAERLIPNLLRQTTGRIESPVGTPVQAVRREAKQGAAAASS